MENEDSLCNRAVPEEMTIELNPDTLTMKGTDKRNPRCIALQGSVGSLVHCSIYENRSSTCRDFRFSGEDDRSNPLCDRARGIYGLLPLLSDIF